MKGDLTDPAPAVLQSVPGGRQIVAEGTEDSDTSDNNFTISHKQMDRLRGVPCA